MRHDSENDRRKSMANAKHFIMWKIIYLCVAIQSDRERRGADIQLLPAGTKVSRFYGRRRMVS